MTKTTRRALWTSLLSVLLCLSMLIGTTFAWFTDSVSSGMNQIIAGNLDIDLEYSTNMSSWNPVEGAANMFKQDTLWEPGHTEVVYLRLSNKGSLDLKFKFSMNFEDVVKGQTENGDEIALSKFLKYDIIEVTSAFADRPAARSAVENTAVDLAGETIDGTIAANTVAPVLALVVYMPESVGNNANYRGTAAPKIELGIRVLAAQLNSEEDSFDSSFDIGAEYESNNNVPVTPTYFVGSAADLAAALAPTVSNDEVKVVLTQNIELATGETWTPLNLEAYSNTVRNIVIDGQGHTIKGLNAPLIGHAYFGNTSIEIKNLTLTNANIESAGFNGTGLGAFVGAADNCKYVVFENCHLTDSTITCTANISGVGGIIGFSSSDLTMTNCSVSNTTVIGNNDSVGALIGHTYVATITNAKVVGCTLTGETANKTGYVVGTVNADTTLTTSAECAGNTVFGTADSTAIYGRVVGATLTLNGAAVTP